ncbi:MAG: vWA domain-containing protein [Desulfurococcaceae archaeon]
MAVDSRTLCIAFALDVSQSMKDSFGFLGRKIDVAKRLLLELSFFLLKTVGCYRLHLYLFPSQVPELVPHERLHQGFVTDKYSVDRLETLLSQLTETRPRTPLIEALEKIAMEVESRCVIVVITDGEIAHPAISGRTSELSRVLEEKSIESLILVLNTRPPDFLEALASTVRRIHLEVLRPSLLHSGIIGDTAKHLSSRLASLTSGRTRS